MLATKGYSRLASKVRVQNILERTSKHQQCCNKQINNNARRQASSKTTSKSPVQAKPKTPPEIKIDPNSDSILHQKAARASELHAELNALLDSQAKRRADEANRPFGAGFLQFLKNSKSEMINIFAAFTCVILAWQITSMRKGALRLLDEAEDREVKMEGLKKILGGLCTDEFSARVLKAYMDKESTSNTTEDSDNILSKDDGKKNKNWFFGSKESSRKDNANELTEDEAILLQNVIRDELQNAIGDAALTEYELEAKKLAGLQISMGIREDQRNKTAVTSGEEQGLENILAEIQIEGKDDGAVVRRRGGFI